MTLTHCRVVGLYLLVSCASLLVALDYDALASDDLRMLMRSYSDREIVGEVTRDLGALDNTKRTTALILLGLSGDQMAVAELSKYIKIDSVPLDMRMKAVIPLAVNANDALLEEWILAGIGKTYNDQWKLAKDGKLMTPTPMDIGRIYAYGGLALSRLYQREFRTVVIDHMSSSDKMVRLGCVSLFLQGRGFPDDLKSTAGYQWDSEEMPSEKVIGRWRQWLEHVGDSEVELARARQRMFDRSAGKVEVPADPVAEEIKAARAKLAMAGAKEEIKIAALELEAILKKRNPDAWVDYSGRDPQPSPSGLWRREAVLESVNYVWTELEIERANTLRDVERVGAASRSRSEYNMAKRRSRDPAANTKDHEAYSQQMDRAELILARWKGLLDNKKKLVSEYGDKREIPYVVGIAYLAPRAMNAMTMKDWDEYAGALFELQSGGLVSLEVKQNPLVHKLKDILKDVLELKGTVPEVNDRDKLQP